MTAEKIKKILTRYLTPSILVTVYYLAKYRAFVSHRSEVDLTSKLVFGPKCVVGSFSKIKVHGGWMTMGQRGGIATGCFVSAHEKGIEIGENFICGPNVNIVGGNYDLSEKDVHLEDLQSTSRGIKIGDNVWVGAGSTILDGAVLGNNTIVVANSLVNRRYPDNVVLQGNPAKIILKR